MVAAHLAEGAARGHGHALLFEQPDGEFAGVHASRGDVDHQVDRAARDVAVQVVFSQDIEGDVAAARIGAAHGGHVVLRAVERVG